LKSYDSPDFSRVGSGLVVRFLLFLAEHFVDQLVHVAFGPGRLDLFLEHGEHVGARVVRVVEEPILGLLDCTVLAVL